MLAPYEVNKCERDYGVSFGMKSSNFKYIYIYIFCVSFGIGLWWSCRSCSIRSHVTRRSGSCYNPHFVIWIYIYIYIYIYLFIFPLHSYHFQLNCLSGQTKRNIFSAVSWLLYFYFYEPVSFQLNKKITYLRVGLFSKNKMELAIYFSL